MVTTKKVPAIRFKSFEEEWEEKKLGEIGDIVGGGTPTTSNKDFWDGSIDWYSPTEIGDHIYTNGSNRKITQLGLEKSSATILPANRTVLFTSRAGIGDMAILKNQGATNQGFQSLVLDEECDTYFVYSMGFLIKKFALKYASGSTFLEVSGKTLEKMSITIPKPTEQIQIGNYFKELDGLIQLQEQKLEKVTNLKKAMLEKMFPIEGADIPEIRFKGFNEKWEKKKLVDTLDFNIPTNTLSRALLNEKQGVIKNIHYGDILIKYNTCLDVSQQSIPYITKGNINDFKNCYLKDGDIIFADAAEDETVGKSIEICNIDGNHVVSGLHTIAARPFLKFEKYYLGYYLNSKSYHNQLVSYMQGTKVLSISKTNLKKTILVYPSNEKEQKKIGKYFHTLDQLISQCQQKTEQLKHLKQALLQKMFI